MHQASSQVREPAAPPQAAGRPRSFETSLPLDPADVEPRNAGSGGPPPCDHSAVLYGPGELAMTPSRRSVSGRIHKGCRRREGRVVRVRGRSREQARPTRSGLSSTPGRRRWTMASNNAVTVARYWGDVWSKGDLGVAEVIFDLNCRDHDLNCHRVKPDREGMIEKVLAYRTAMPDLTVTVDRQVEAGDQVVSYWKVYGTHNGEALG